MAIAKKKKPDRRFSKNRGPCSDGFKGKPKGTRLPKGGPKFEKHPDVPTLIVGDFAIASASVSAMRRIAADSVAHWLQVWTTSTQTSWKVARCASGRYYACLSCHGATDVWQNVASVK